MAKYHINPETGRPGECTATVKGCAYAVNNMLPEHYDNIDDALDAYEKLNENRTLKSLKKIETNETELINEAENKNNNSINSSTSTVESEEIVLINEDNETNMTLLNNLSSEDSKELETKSDTWIKTISNLNPHSQEFNKHTQSITKIANKAFASTAELSTNFLNSAYDRKDSASSKVGKDLYKLRTVIENMAPKDDTFKSKALSFLPGRNVVKNYFNRFESNTQQMNAIMQSLDRGQATLSQENAELEVERQQLWRDLEELQKAEGLLKSMDNKVVEKIDQEKAKGNTKMVEALGKNVLFNIRQRRQDVATQTAVTVQSYMAMGIIEENNNKLAQNVERTKTTTATALATSARIAKSLGHQKEILNGIDFMRSTTNDLIANNSRELQQNALQIQKQSTTASVDTEVLKSSFDNMFKTLDEMDNFREESNKNFLDTINTLHEQVNKANTYARKRNSSQGDNLLEESPF